jgi:hypothetical protein
MPGSPARSFTPTVASPPDTEIPTSHFRQGRTSPPFPRSQRGAGRRLGPMLRAAVVSTVTLRRFRS